MSRDPRPGIREHDDDPWGLDDDIAVRPDHPSREALASAAARCFRGDDGRLLVRHLRALTIGRALAPTADDRMLRHLEGQRQLVAHILQLIAQGRHGPIAENAGETDNPTA